MVQSRANTAALGAYGALLQRSQRDRLRIDHAKLDNLLHQAREALSPSAIHPVRYCVMAAPSGITVLRRVGSIRVASSVVRSRDYLHVKKPALISIGVGSICYSLPDAGHPAWLLLSYIAVTTALLTVS
jgi:hypothetical protein